MEEGSVQLAAQQEAAAGVPPEWRAIVSQVPSKRLEVPGGVDQFEKTVGEPGIEALP